MEKYKRGSIAFFSTYRPPVPLDIFSCPSQPTSVPDEVHMTDGDSYNYNGQVIPLAALKTILKRPKLANSQGGEADVDSGDLTGMIFVSERGNLETLHIALRYHYNPPQIFSFADVFGTFDGVRMEDSGSIAGDYLIYVSTMVPAKERRQPWTAVYKTNLQTGKTDRLTPEGEADLSPSVSPSGKKIAVASFERKGGWDGEIEDLKTDIFAMDVDNPSERRLVIRNGGWPTWGSDNVIFFHRKVGEFWGVFRADISNGETSDTPRVTPVDIDAMTPVAINATKVVVATIRQKSQSNTIPVEAKFRHIEIFEYSTTGQQDSIQITQKIVPEANHFNPFLIDGGKRIGYHRCIRDPEKSAEEMCRELFQNLKSPHRDVGLFRVPGVFPTFSPDGSQLAFVDNEFKKLWLADSNQCRIVYKSSEPNYIFWPVWNPDPAKDTLYVCVGPSFNAKEPLEICAIPDLSKKKQQREKLTKGGYNNAFPSPNPDGTKIVFRSTRGGEGYKNLYIMEDAKNGEFSGGVVTRLTDKKCTDTHCQWSPTGDWVVFSSSRDKPEDAPKKDNNLDPGYFAVFLVNVKKRDVVIRVMESRIKDLAGHVNHPFFSPDGKSIVVTGDLAAVSADPISLPLFLHSVRPYGDVFTFEIDTDDIHKNESVKKTFNRITHSRYENCPGAWTMSKLLQR
ncbi:hypothetical protein UlMin_011594 [Ulmus minor]